MLYQNYIWDFDGTLFNTYPHIAYSLLEALKEFGIREETEPVMRELKKNVGAANQYFAEKYGLKTAELRSRYDKIENAEPVLPVCPYPGARECVEAIKSNGGKHFLYTHRNGTVYRFLRKADFENYFTGKITALDGFPPKPAPDAILHILETYGLEPDETVMVGDRPIDLDAGKNAGIAGILFDPEGFYPDYPAVYRVQSMEELKALCMEKK